jgi:hypothetical protein
LAQNGGWGRIEAVGERAAGGRVSVALRDTIQALEEWAAIFNVEPKAAAS